MPILMLVHVHITSHYVSLRDQDNRIILLDMLDIITISAEKQKFCNLRQKDRDILLFDCLNIYVKTSYCFNIVI